MTSSQSPDATVLTKRHLRFGWWTLFVFLTLGLVLEGLHGFKVGAYLSAKNETRRLMWTLAHAHGTLFGILNIAFVFTVRLLPDWTARGRGVASNCLLGASLLMPAGFFLGGVHFYSGDPGLGIVLVPIGGLMLILAVFLVASRAGSIRAESPSESRSGKATSQRREK